VIIIELNKVNCGDALELLKTFPDNSINCVVTSPPYYNLRSYLPDDDPNKDKEIGTEKSPEEYVASLVTIFSEVKRVLRPTGVCYLNIGDSYATKGFRGGEYNIKKKDLMLIPHRVAIALCDDGWYIRSDICYSKVNCMPSSVKDRPVSSKEYVFMITKSPNYYWNWEAIATEPAELTQNDKRPKGVLRQCSNARSKYHNDCDPKIEQQFRKQDNIGRSDYTGFNDRYTPVDLVRPRDVWRMTVPGSKIKHFAIMNVNLISKCILSGCPENGIVLDPFAGINSVGMVAHDLNRNYIGIELNPEYIKTAEQYLQDYRYDPESHKVIKKE
jgi:DNA modification methylase